MPVPLLPPKLHDNHPDKRRMRNQVVPTGVKVTPRERDIAVAEMLHLHGPLPTSFLFEFAKQWYKDEKSFVTRLTSLSHETSVGYEGKPIEGPFLRRMSEAKASIYSVTNQEIYDLTPASKYILQLERKWRENAPARTSSWFHDYMSACVTASINIACLRQSTKYKYYFHHQLVDDIGTATFEVPGFERRLRPDPMCMVEYLDSGATIIFPTEQDCGNQQSSITSTILQRKKEISERKIHEQNMQQWHAFLDTEKYKTYFGQNASMMLLNTFNKQSTMIGVKQIAANLGSYNMCFRYLPGFETKNRAGKWVFRTPKPMVDLLGVWERAGRTDFDISIPEGKKEGATA